MNNVKVLGGLVILVGGYYLLTSSSKRPLKILFVGDSNTFAPYSYADKLKLKYPQFEIKKIAKIGEPTSWMLQNLEEDLKNNKYDIVAILGGSNDVYGNTKLDLTKNNLTKMKELIKNSGAKSVLVTPPNKKFFPKNTIQKLNNLNDLISWEKKQDFDYVIDFHDMTDKLDLFSSDLQHPNSNAHDILANVFEKTLGIA